MRSKSLPSLIGLVASLLSLSAWATSCPNAETITCNAKTCSMTGNAEFQIVHYEPAQNNFNVQFTKATASCVNEPGTPECKYPLEAENFQCLYSVGTNGKVFLRWNSNASAKVQFPPWDDGRDAWNLWFTCKNSNPAICAWEKISSFL